MSLWYFQDNPLIRIDMLNQARSTVPSSRCVLCLIFCPMSPKLNNSIVRTLLVALSYAQTEQIMPNIDAP